MNDKIAATRSRLAELAEKFLGRSESDVASIRACLIRVAAGEAAALDEVRHLAHRMVGTGATLGFDALSDCARRIEMLAESRTPRSAGDDLRTQLADALDALAAELQRARAEKNNIRT